MRPTNSRAGLARTILAASLLALAACEAGPAPATPPISPGTATAPREVNLIARDYAFRLDGAPFPIGDAKLAPAA